MEGKSSNGIKNALFLILVFFGILIGTLFIFATIIVLFRIVTESNIEKGIVSCLLLSIILTTIIRYKRSRKKFNFRYWFSFTVFFAGIIFTVFLAGDKLLTFVDVPGLLIIGIVPFLFVSILFGFKEMVLAFSIQSIEEPDKETLKKSFRFFETYGKITLISGVISVIIGIVSMLKNLDDKSAIGPNLALALISIFYCCIIYVIIIIPFTVFIKNKLNE
jgi:flagellar motor component MotA